MAHTYNTNHVPSSVLDTLYRLNVNTLNNFPKALQLVIDTGGIELRQRGSRIHCIILQFSSVQFSCLVMSDSLRPCELQHGRPPVHQQVPEFTQTHVHQVGDAIQPSHPLSSPSPPAPNPSQHQSLFQ